MNPHSNPNHDDDSDDGRTRPSYRRPTQPHGDDDQLLTIDEVAGLTRLPVATLRYKRHDHSGPRSFRMGRRVFYWLSDVLTWIDRHYNDDGPRGRLTEPVVSDNTEWTSVRFTQSARKHRIGRASARHVMATTDPVAVETTSGADAWLWIGADERGRDLEVIGIEVAADDTRPYLLVLHVMPLNFRR